MMNIRHNNKRGISQKEKDMKLLTTKDAARIISEMTNKPISVSEVQREIKKGYIKAEKIGYTYLIKESSLKNYQRRPTGPRPGVSRKPKPQI